MAHAAVSSRKPEGNARRNEPTRPKGPRPRNVLDARPTTKLNQLTPE